MQPDWQRRRSDFNHQWLKNRFLSALDAADQVIRGRIRGADYLQELLEVDLPEWPERRGDLNALLEDFESDMSPRRLFDGPPLCECGSPARETLADLMHELWVARYPISGWLENARAAASKVDEHHELLRGTAPLDDSGGVRAEFAERLDGFRAACRSLSKALEKFPNRILVA